MKLSHGFKTMNDKMLAMLCRAIDFVSVSEADIFWLQQICSPALISHCFPYVVVVGQR